MEKLLRFHKPYTLQILLILGLLFGSALADLFLPTLMADIVNFGVVKANVPTIFRTGGKLFLQ
ncbi:MAG: ABC transporter ATP-binding protein [Candidatus Firestonebacteria bacterium]|nr:ABC transporter ATP-binding protein [Candidatus Firestonebacteria bacterium]